jgi:translation elongation factor EF-G
MLTFPPNLLINQHVTDGTFAVVDHIEGVCTQNVTFKSKPLTMHIKLVLIINKRLIAILGLQVDKESLF